MAPVRDSSLPGLRNIKEQLQGVTYKHHVSNGAPGLPQGGFRQAAVSGSGPDTGTGSSQGQG